MICFDHHRQDINVRSSFGGMAFEVVALVCS
jgi:hypothetical protein